ncbi:protein NO VEIN domain-containing protein [Brachybacterium paraconglomeratum]|uniref:protein NO VEIN domain-containing protein n=1 Tax=Brachybacterium paraconglomeratum TaxID=173362 RepID=UPI00351510C8
MNQADLLKLSNHEIEARAIDAVIAFERAAGRTAVDLRSKKDALVDVESLDDVTGEKRLIEIKAFGGAGRGDFLWLEPNQVKAFEQDPAAHLYLVTNVRSADPSAIRILDLTGEQLRERLGKKREKHYFEVPMPVAVYDNLVANAAALPALDGTGFLLQILDGVLALHERGYHRTRFAAAWAPDGLHVRLHVGRESEMLGDPLQVTTSDLILSTSLDDAQRTAREFAGVMISAWWDRDQIADQLLAALPPVEPAGDDPEYRDHLRELYERHRAAGTLPFTDDEGGAWG